MKKSNELDTGTRVRLKDNSICEVCCYLFTTPSRLYAVRNLRTRQVFSIHPSHIVSIIKKKDKLKDILMKKALDGNKKAIKLYIKKYKKYPR